MRKYVFCRVLDIRVADIMDAAGIDLNSIQTFYFWTNDKTSSYYTTFPKTELIDTPRYCYYSLPDNFDQETGRGTASATEQKERVDTLIALADDWNRCIAGATFGSDYLNLNTNTRFRLIYGQTDTSTRTASRSAKWIHEIVVELGGSPSITLDASVLDLEVGSLWKTTASVSAADSVITENEPVIWSSSDESVATVDENGNITVHSEGTAVITATFAGVSTSVTVNGTPGGTADTPAQDDGSETGASSESGDPSPSEADEPGEASVPGESGLGGEDIYEILQNDTETGSEEGGVQNWRMYEMSESAVELPVIKEENPLFRFTMIAVFALFAGSAILTAVKFRRETRGQHNVFSVRSK